MAEDAKQAVTKILMRVNAGMVAMVADGEINTIGTVRIE
jgi:hypothetical protein